MASNIHTSSLPPQSILTTNAQSYHYVDSYQGTFSDPNDQITAAHVGKAFFMGGPKWMEHLFAFRNWVVKLFGLKTPDGGKNRQEILQQFKCNVGDRMGLFQVYYKSPQEVVIGEDDKHLDFRVSLFIRPSEEQVGNKELTISTVVTFHNTLGRMYFLPVKPFHHLIVPAMLKDIIKTLEKNDQEPIFPQSSIGPSNH